MPPPEDKDICEITPLTDASHFRTVIDHNSSGIVMVPQETGHLRQISLKADAGDFTKWMKVNYPVYKVVMPKVDNLLLLRSADCWFPLVYIANDIALPIYLNLVSSYVYDTMKGALKGEKKRVRLSVVYEDKKDGIAKRFDFSGDSEALKNTIKKFDMNKFFDEPPSKN